MPNSILASPDQVIAALESHGCKPKRSGDGWKAKCPAHDGKTQSLSVDDGDTGNAAVIHCFSGCEYRDVMHALGLNQANSTKRQIVTTYDYDGHFETVRYSPKGFAQRRKQASGEYAWNLKGVAVRLYRQDHLIAAKPSQVVVVEGEKDVDTLRGVGVLAVTNHGGAGKWRKAHTAALVEAEVKDGCSDPRQRRTWARTRQQGSGGMQARGSCGQVGGATGERRHRLSGAQLSSGAIGAHFFGGGLDTPGATGSDTKASKQIRTPHFRARCGARFH